MQLQIMKHASWMEIKVLLNTHTTNQPTHQTNIHPPQKQKQKQKQQQQQQQKQKNTTDKN